MSSKEMESKSVEPGRTRVPGPKLRFPEFLNYPEWIKAELDALIAVVTPPKKIPTSEYGAAGPTPIYDQSQNDVAGWTQDENARIGANLPLIIFGDHTCALKIARVPFAQGADGIKIFWGSSEVQTEYIFQYLQHNPVVMEEYKRHFSILKERTILFPEIADEQQKVAGCLSSLDELISAERQKLAALTAHKKGLMQQLFPAEGETVPRLRFPEFAGRSEWKEVPLSKLGSLVSGLTYRPEDVRDSGLLVLRSSNINKGEIILEDCVYVDPQIKGAELVEPNDILICVRNGSKALIGKSALIPRGMPQSTHGAFMTVFRSPTPHFVFQLFQTSRYQKLVAADLGATINSINGAALLKYKFRVPGELEQKKIAYLLSMMDAWIFTQAQRVDSLKKHKYGLMQQLFPSLDEVQA